MADERFTGNKNIDVWWLDEGDYVNEEQLTADEINAGERVTLAIAWDGTSFPAAGDSDSDSDLGLWDDANATTRGAPSFDAALNFFFPKDLTENVTDYGRVYQHFRKLGLKGVLVTRVSQLSATGVATPAAAGQWISVFKGITDGFETDIEGDDSYKYAITYLPQGYQKVYTQVKNAGPVVITRLSTAGAVAPGEHVVLRATLGGHYATQVVDWKSSNPAVAQVSQNGVVTVAADAVDAATTNITATHPAATGVATAHVITVEV